MMELVTNKLLFFLQWSFIHKSSHESGEPTGIRHVSTIKYPVVFRGTNFDQKEKFETLILLFAVQPYATTFPIFSLEDMVKSLFMLLDHLGIDKVCLVATVYHHKDIVRIQTCVMWT